jgi:KDO2-lipid IV(A) lauroyltransferase
MKKITDILITYILMLLAIISRILNIKQRVKFGILIGDFLRILSKKRERITYNNIKNSLDRSDHETKHITIEAYRNLGITLAELLVLSKLNEKQLQEYVKYENIDLIEKTAEEGKGVILLSGHFGNWEYLAYTAGLFTKLPLTVIVKPQSNKFADKYLNRTRISGGNEIVSMHKAARKIVKELTSGNIIALLADQSTSGKNDVLVDFFRRQTPTYSAPASLSLKFGSPIIIGFANRQKDGTYLVKLEKIDPKNYTNDEKGIIKLTQAHVKLLENAIKERPELWSWQHRRWKHSPDEEK